jgi:CRP-like cAMP-binding protein
MQQLSRIRVLENVPPEVLERMERHATALEPRSGAEVFSQGEPAAYVYAIISGEGCVRIGSMDRRSKRLMVEVLTAGDLFGEIGVLDGLNRTATATAEGRVRLLRISASTFLAAVADAPVLGLNLARALSRRLRRTFELFQDATFETLEVRLARQLLYLAGSGRRTELGVMLAARLRQHDLADLLGATQRSIITILNDWRAAGIVQYDTVGARITLCDEARMRALIDGDA